MTRKLLNTALKIHARPEDATPQDDAFVPEYRQVASHDIRYVRGPLRSAPNLVLLNGMPQSIRCWESHWDDLTQNFNVLAFDMPGFGLSKGRPEYMSPAQMAALLPQVMDVFGMDTAYLVGPDVGAPVALATAIKHPGRLRGINVFDGPGHYLPDMDPALIGAIKSPMTRWLLGGPLRSYLMKLNFQASVDGGYTTFKPTVRAVQEYYAITHDVDQTRNALAFLGSYKQDLSWIGASLPDIRTPTLITWGTEDRFVKPSNADHLHKHLPNSTLHMLAGAGHYSHEDAGPAYTKVLFDWITKQEGVHMAETMVSS